MKTHVSITVDNCTKPFKEQLLAQAVSAKLSLGKLLTGHNG